MGVYKSQLSYRSGVGQPVIYFVDTTAELPVTGLLSGADIAFCHEDKCWYVATSSTEMGKAATSHSHTAAQLGSGTPTGGKFLRDDLSWAAPPGGDGASLPAGCILMWHGLLANIPAGFVLCDGQNGTPDLRSKFVKGAAAAANPGATGGSATHTHDDHAALTHSGAAVADHASHTHTYTQVPNHVHSFTDLRGATTGSATTNRGVTEGADTSSTVTGLKTGNPDGGVATGTTNGPGATLTHSVTQPNQHAAQSHSAASNEPAFYAVAFIMKT